MCLLQVRRLIALLWKNTQRQQIDQWLSEMSNSNNCCAMEKITCILKRKSESLDMVWGLFTQLLRTVNMSDMLSIKL